MSQTDPYNNPLDPGADQSGDGSSGGSDGSGVDWGSLLGDVGGFLKDHGADILKTGGSAANAYLDYIAKQQAIAERKREFDAQNQLQQGYQGMTAASQLNRAPLADKGQYLALNAAAPTAFKPRDYTQGLATLRTPASGGAADQLTSNAASNAAYTPGAGGVNTDTLKMILSRIGAAPNGGPITPVPGANLPPGASTTPTNSMTQEQYDAYRKAHPELFGGG